MELEEVSLRHPSDISPEEFAQSAALEYILDGIESEHGEKIVGMLAEEGEATSRKIAGELGVDVNSVRETLESLYDARAVNLRRSRDSETGWITFHWRLSPSEALRRLIKEKQSLLHKTVERLEREREAIYFACESRCVKVELDEAMENEFKCPVCGGKLYEFDNTDTIQVLEEKVEKLERDLRGEDRHGR